MITVRAKLKHGGYWYALGAKGNDTVVIREKGDYAEYFWSENGGKNFNLRNNATGKDRATLKVKWPAGALVTFNSILEVKFFGGNKVAQLRPMLQTLGFMEERKTRTFDKKASLKVGGNMLTIFPQLFQKKFGQNIRWSSNLGTSQELIYKLYCSKKTFVGKSEVSQKDAKLKAIAKAMEEFSL